MKSRSSNSTTIAVFVLIFMILFVITMILVVLFDFSGKKTPNVPVETTIEGINFTTTTPPVTTEERGSSTVSTPEDLTTPVPNTGISTTSGTQGTVTPPVTTPPVTTIPKAPTDEYKYEFKADLSDYEIYMNPTGDKWDNAYLLLVNPDNPIEKGEELTYEALKDLVRIGDVSKVITRYPNLKTNRVALMALEAMSLELKAYGISGLDTTSAYRDYATQQTIFERNVSNTKKYVCDDCSEVFIGKSSYSKCSKCGGNVTRVTITREEAVENVKTYSCAPGTSEHQSTLVFDVIVTTYPSRFNSLIQEFGETEAGIWLAENCYKFGFILRFPEDKEDITGIIYEPWHFRFVGRYHATRMHELGMCLEEYIVYLDDNGYFES